MYRDGKMVDRRELLKIKLKTLAAEIKFIRHEERRTWGPMMVEMYHHRQGLSFEAHCTLLAYQIIRGKTTPEQVRDELRDSFKRMAGPYGQDEFWYKKHMKPYAEKVEAMMVKYGAPKSTIEAGPRPMRLDYAQQSARLDKSIQRRAAFSEQLAQTKEIAGKVIPDTIAKMYLGQ